MEPDSRNDGLPPYTIVEMPGLTGFKAVVDLANSTVYIGSAPSKDAARARAEFAVKRAIQRVSRIAAKMSVQLAFEDAHPDKSLPPAARRRSQK